MGFFAMVWGIRPISFYLSNDGDLSLLSALAIRQDYHLFLLKRRFEIFQISQLSVNVPSLKAKASRDCSQAIHSEGQNILRALKSLVTL